MTAKGARMEQPFHSISIVSFFGGAKIPEMNLSFLVTLSNHGKCRMNCFQTDHHSMRKKDYRLWSVVDGME